MRFEFLAKYEIMKKGCVAVCFAVLLLLIACDNNEKWTIKGQISGVDGDTIYVKHLVNNQYQTLEKQALKKDGRFTFKLEKQTFPEFYFLQLNKSAHLVVLRDSSDVVELNAKASDFSEAEIMGSTVAQRIQSCMVDVKQLRSVYTTYKNASPQQQEAMGPALLENYAQVKKNLGQEIYKDPKSLCAYYILYQRVDEQNMMFSPYAQEDYNYFAAVATSYGVYRKDDPRTKALHDVVMGALEVKRKAALQEMVANAPSGIPEIVKKDVNGIERKLSDLKDKVVILNFWMSQSPESLAFNKALRRLYVKYHRRGLEIFQVSSDQSKLLWTEAINRGDLPWINVCDCSSEMDQHFAIYNVQRVPTTFLIGRDGVMINRFKSVTELEAAIKDAL